MANPSRPTVPSGSRSHVDPAPGSVDPVVGVKAASRGFTVLALGAVVQPWVGHLLPPLGYVWLVVVAVASFVTAAWTAGSTLHPVRQGVVGALGAYALMVPLVHLATGSLDPVQVAGTTVTAVVVGAVTGWLRGLSVRGRG